jgi:hypothetical protein
MKANFVCFDTLNRRMLPYGCEWVNAPNFARRELHTGRYNFLHRSWGSLEPFDESLPQLLTQNGVRAWPSGLISRQPFWYSLMFQSPPPCRVRPCGNVS